MAALETVARTGENDFLYRVGEVFIPQMDVLPGGQSMRFNANIVEALENAGYDTPDWLRKGGTPLRPRDTPAKAPIKKSSKKTPK